MENKTLFEGRQRMYRLLSRLYVLEVDEELLSALGQVKYPAQCPNEEMAEGYRMIAEYLKDSQAKDRQEVLDDLAVDYARIFLSAGVAQGKAAFPYESVYTSKKHLMMQESRNEVVALYGAKGVKPSQDMYRVPEDHLGLLLEYMALLCQECLQAEAPKAAKASLEEQAVFLKEHLNNWVPAFAGEVQKYAGTDFYKGLARLTRGFLMAEKDLVLGLEV